MTVVWTENRAQADTSLLRLGSCLPTSSSPRESVFVVDVNDCNFSRMVCKASNGGGGSGLQVKPTVCVPHRLLAMSLSTPMS